MAIRCTENEFSRRVPEPHSFKLRKSAQSLLTVRNFPSRFSLVELNVIANILVIPLPSHHPRKGSEFPHPWPAVPLSEGIGHGLCKLPGDDAKVGLKVPAGGGMGEDVHVIALNGHVPDLYPESFGVVAIDAVECCKRGGMAKAAR